MDPKVPTADNVNQLKSALMAALAKSKEKREETVIKKEVPAIMKSVIAPKPTVIPQAVAKVSPVAPKEVPKELPNEVPEDVLKKVLKID